MAKKTCYVPQLCLTEGGNAAVEIRKGLRQALADNLTPAPLPPGAKAITVDLDDYLLERLKPFEESTGLTVGRVAGGLLYARHLMEGQPKEAPKRVLTPILSGLRVDQQRVLENVAPLLKQGQVVLSECGTGSGKSRIIAHAAAYALGLRNAGQLPPLPEMEPPETFLNENHQKAYERLMQRVGQARDNMANRESKIEAKPLHPVIVTAPTIENVSHLVQEWLQCAPHLNPKGLISTAVVIGRSQFVSPSALRQLFEDRETGEGKLKAWLEGGMRPGKSKEALGLREFVPDVCGLVKDFRQAAKGLHIPLSKVVLGVDSPGEELRRFNVFKHKAKLAGIALSFDQFVSESALAAWVQGLEDGRARMERWLEEGMPAGLTTVTQRFKAFDPNVKGLMEDLEHLTKDMDVNVREACLDTDSPAIEQNVYLDMRNKAFHVDLIFTTHAMLCLDNMNLHNDLHPLLPAPCALFIDEAHQLESIQADMASRSLSFQRLGFFLKNTDWTKVKKQNQADKAYAKVKSIHKDLQAFPEDAYIPFESRNQDLTQKWESVSKRLRELQDLLRRLRNKVTDDELDRLDAQDEQDKSEEDAAPKAFQKPLLTSSYRYVDNCVAALSRLENHCTGRIFHSPIQGKVSFLIGPNSVAKHLSSRWATVPTAMLLSGTLLHHTEGPPQHEPMARDLSIPDRRVAKMDPVHPHWIHSTPTLWMPEAIDASLFTPPQLDKVTEETLLAWCSEVARVIEKVAERAAGGTLILMTGYQRVECLEIALLKRSPELASRLVVQTRDNRASACIHAFREMHAKGLRPIWIGAGGAWTGVDLRDTSLDDDRAEQDTLLTDLVIPAVPFGLNRTTTVMARIERHGFPIETVRAQRMFRQGLGRLVRREGLLDRNVWVLDGRLKNQSAQPYTKDMRRWLHRYPKTDSFYVSEIGDVVLDSRRPPN